MTIPNELYTKVAVEIARAVVGVINFEVLGEVGFDRVTKDVFDFTDAFCEELAVRLGRNVGEIEK